MKIELLKTKELFKQQFKKFSIKNIVFLFIELLWFVNLLLLIYLIFGYLTEFGIIFKHKWHITFLSTSSHLLMEFILIGIFFYLNDTDDIFNYKKGKVNIPGRLSIIGFCIPIAELILLGIYNFIVGVLPIWFNNLIWCFEV